MRVKYVGEASIFAGLGIAAGLILVRGVAWAWAKFGPT